VILHTEAHKVVFEQSKPQRLLAWLTLGILLTIQISNQWQRFIISTAYQYYTLDPTKPGYNDPKYEMQLAIPGFTAANYGLVAGPFFSLIFGTLVLFTGSLADKFNRRFLLGIAAVAWSLTSLGTSVA